MSGFSRTLPPKFERSGRKLCPVVRDLFDHICKSNLELRVIEEISGVSYGTMGRWFCRGQAPNILSFCAVAAVVGYEVVLKEQASE